MEQTIVSLQLPVQEALEIRKNRIAPQLFPQVPKPKCPHRPPRRFHQHRPKVTNSQKAETIFCICHMPTPFLVLTTI